MSRITSRKSNSGRKYQLLPELHFVTLIRDSIAEVTTGLICVCIPTLGSLVCRRRISRKSDKSPYKVLGTSSRCHAVSRRASKSQEEDLFNPGTVELEHGIRVPTVAVTTGIIGGAESRYDNKLGNAGSEDSNLGNHGILTTVRMEHTYV